MRSSVNFVSQFVRSEVERRGEDNLRGGFSGYLLSYRCSLPVSFLFFRIFALLAIVTITPSSLRDVLVKVVVLPYPSEELFDIELSILVVLVIVVVKALRNVLWRLLPRVHILRWAFLVVLTEVDAHRCRRSVPAQVP